MSRGNSDRWLQKNGKRKEFAFTRCVVDPFQWHRNSKKNSFLSLDIMENIEISEAQCIVWLIWLKHNERKLMKLYYFSHSLLIRLPIKPTFFPFLFFWIFNSFFLFHFARKCDSIVRKAYKMPRSKWFTIFFFSVLVRFVMDAIKSDYHIRGIMAFICIFAIAT